MNQDKKNDGNVDWSNVDFQPLWDELEKKKKEEYREFLEIEDELQEEPEKKEEK